MTWTHPANEYEALLYVVDRLTQRFPAVGEETIHGLVIDQLEQLGASRIRTYVPMLVERDVLVRLRRIAESPERLAG